MTTEQRLSALERRYQRLAQIAGTCIVAMASVILMGQVAPVQVGDLVQARAFEVVGADGRALVRLGSTSSGEGSIAVMNGAGQVLVGISPLQGDGAIVTFSSGGRNLVQVGRTPTGRGAVATFGDGGQALVSLSATQGGNGLLSIAGADGQDLVRAGGPPDGSDAGALLVHGNNGQVIVGLGPTVDGSSGTVLTFNGSSQKLVELNVNNQGYGLVTTFSPSTQNPLVALGATVDGEGIVTTADGRGRNLLQIGVSSSNDAVIATFDQAGGLQALWPPR